jgi:hypothetical protein
MATVIITIEDKQYEDGMRVSVTGASHPPYPEKEEEASPAQLIASILLDDLDELRRLVGKRNAELSELQSPN